MLDDDKNALLTRVGPGTPMGELLRRYWHPIAAAAELDDNPTKAVRLMGEDLVLYRDLSGQYGLIERRCAHRCADLSYGMVEKEGLRCSYHGWMFDHQGRCIERPFEDTVSPGSTQRANISLKAYRAAELGGLIWAYMGPDPVPLVPNWEPFTWSDGFRQIVFNAIPCNWFQCQENSIDPVHFEWNHDNWGGVRLKGKAGPYAPKHLKIEFEEFEYGLQYKRVREGSDEKHLMWTVGRTCLWPNCFFLGDHFEWRVPVDDHNTLSICWFYQHVPQDRMPYVQNRIPYWYSWIKDPATGRWVDSHVINQDFIAWVGQGEISDRRREHLGLSDRGIAMMRRRFFADLELIKQGGDPKAVIRDPAVNQCIPLPIASRDDITKGLTREEQEKDSPRTPQGTIKYRTFPYLVGQPDEVKRAFDDAMGWSR